MKKRIATKARKRHRRNRQSHALKFGLYLKPKSTGVPPADNTGLMASLTLAALLAKKRPKEKP